MLVQIPEHHFVSPISLFDRLQQCLSLLLEGDEILQETQKQSTIKDGETYK